MGKNCTECVRYEETYKMSKAHNSALHNYLTGKKRFSTEVLRF